MFNWLKRILNRNKELKKYRFGDIIWCEVLTYADFKFPEHHRIRPFLFVGYKNNKIYCYTLTHKVQDEYNLHVTLNSSEQSSLILSCLFELPKRKYRSFYKRLDDSAVSHIGKIIYPMQEDDILKGYILKELIIEKNDIVDYKDDTYYVSAKDQNMITIYPFSNVYKDGFYEVKNHEKQEKVYVSIKGEVIKNDEAVYKYSIYTSLSDEIKKIKMEISYQNKSVKQDLPDGAIYKTNSGTYLILGYNSGYYFVIKPYSNDYEIKILKQVSKKKINSISNEKLEVLRKKYHYEKKVKEFLSNK